MEYGGLVNLGATCYLNTALQCLGNCDEFLFIILNNKNDNESSLINEFKSILKELFINKNSLRPNRFINCLKNNIKDIEIHEQNDINEFLSLFLDKLNKDICYKNLIDKNDLMKLNKYKNTSYDVQKFKMDISWVEKTKSEYSELIDLLYGQSITQIICENCKHISHNYELYSSIMVPLCDTLDDSLTEYFQEEFLNDGNDGIEWKCDECCQKKRSRKTTKLWKIPDILIITIKRFTDNLQKNNKNILIPLELSLDKYTLSHTNKKFKLSSVGFHSGSYNNGHYVSLMRSKNDKWFVIDDLDITELNNLNMISQGYVFFYSAFKS
jgi:ubiquitin C-terminal hydrolase